MNQLLIAMVGFCKLKHSPSWMYIVSARGLRRGPSLSKHQMPEINQSRSDLTRLEGLTRAAKQRDRGDLEGRGGRQGELKVNGAIYVNSLTFLIA